MNGTAEHPSYAANGLPEGTAPGVRIADVIVGDRARKDYGDLASLMESIREHDLLQPVGLLPGNHLLFGGRRLEACKRLGWDSVPVTYPATQADALSLLKAERDENTCRKDMTYSEKVGIADRIADMERPKASERRTANLPNGPAGPLGEARTNEAPSYRRSTDVAAEAVGMSRKSYERAKLVTDAAENPNVTEDVRHVARAARDAMDAGDIGLTAAQRQVNDALGRPAQSTAPADKPSRPAPDTLTPTSKGANGRTSRSPGLRSQRAELIAELAEQGYSSRQMPAKVGVTELTVRKIAREDGIEIPADKAIGGTRRHDSTRIAGAIVADLESMYQSIELIDYDDIDQEQARQWASSLDESFKTLRDFRTQINRIAGS